MNLKLLIALIIIDGLLFNCVLALPTLKRSNRAVTLSLSKTLTLVKDFYQTAKDFNKALRDGMQLMGNIRNTFTAISSAPYRITQNLLDRIQETVNFGLSIPGEIGNFIANELENTVMLPYNTTMYFLSWIGL